MSEVSTEFVYAFLALAAFFSCVHVFSVCCRLLAMLWQESNSGNITADIPPTYEEATVSSTV